MSFVSTKARARAALFDRRRSVRAPIDQATSRSEKLARNVAAALTSRFETRISQVELSRRGIWFERQK